MIRTLVASDISQLAKQHARVQVVGATLRNETLVNTGFVTASRGYARYIGISPTSLSFVRAWLNHGGAAIAGAGGDSLNWAELAVATGIPNRETTTVTLTTLAAASIDVVGGANRSISAVLTTHIPARVPYWIVFASAYETTQATMRGPNGADYLGLAATRDAYRPSLNIGAALTFTTNPGFAVNVSSLRATTT